LIDERIQEKKSGKGFLTGITLNVFMIGLVSFLTDASSEIIYPLMPAFLALASVGHGVAPALLIGILEGFAETASALLKLAGGIWTDRVRRKKPLILAGYGISSVFRPLVGLATAWWQPVVLRVIDRVGKGIRTAPRDALIAESTPKEYCGKAYGFHRSMDHLGAVVGPLLAVALIFFLSGRGTMGQERLLRTVFLLAAVPGALCLAVLIFWIKDVNATPTGKAFHLTWRAFNPNFRLYLTSLLVFTLGNSTDMFLILRAAEVIKGAGGGLAQGRWALAMVPLLWAFFHVFKSASTAPLGALSDRIGRKSLIGLGWGVYALVYLGFALMNRPWQAWPLFAVYALYYGLTEGVEKAFIVDLAPAELRGTALGMYNFVIGIAALPASLLFGYVYVRAGALTAFGYAALLAVFAVALLSLKVRENPGPARA